MLWPLLICILGFAAFIGWVTIIRMKNEIILRDMHRPWVAKMFGVIRPESVRRGDKILGANDQSKGVQ